MAKSVEAAFQQRARDPQPLISLPHPITGVPVLYAYDFLSMPMTQTNTKTIYSCSIRRHVAQGDVHASLPLSKTEMILRPCTGSARGRGMCSRQRELVRETRKSIESTLVEEREGERQKLGGMGGD